MSTSLTNSVVRDDDVILRWQVHMARRQPEKLLVVMAAIAVTGALAVVLFGSILPGIIIAFVLVGALSDFLLPVTYTFSSTRATASTRLGLRVIEWKNVRTVYVDGDGVKLSPLRRRSRLEAYRGVYVRFGDRRDEILSAVKELKPNAE